MDKQAIRERVWADLEDSGEARFPFPPQGRIPNVAGAEDAAHRLRDHPAWESASVIKANPDAPQLPVRRAALRAGKTVYMAVPRLREAECFRRLAPEEIEDIGGATTVSGSAEAGVPVGPAAVEPIDLVVAGSVAVTADGARIGKGEGYSDLEYAILAEFDRVGPETTTVTTVHERQVVDDAVVSSDHDVPMDLVVTPERTIETGGPAPSDPGIAWDTLDSQRRAEIPILQRLETDDI